MIHGGNVGPIGEEHADAIADHVGSLLRRGTIDVVALHYYATSHPLHQSIGRISGPLTRDRARLEINHHVRDLTLQEGPFLNTISGKHRWNLRRDEKRLLGAFEGDVVVACLDGPADVPRLLDEAGQIAKASYQHRLGVGFSAEPTIADRLALMAEKGWLRARILRLGGKPAGLWIGAAYRGTFHSDYLAYDAEFAEFAPGSYMMMKTLEEFHDKLSGIRLIDFGGGDAAFKERFGNVVRTEALLHAFAMTPRAIWVNGMRTISSAGFETAKTVLARAGMLDEVTTKLRRMRKRR